MNINWKEVHTIPFKSLISTKIRAFQYKYLMRIIPNNQFLYKCNINSTSLCDFCTMYVETNKLTNIYFGNVTVLEHFGQTLKGFLMKRK